MHSSSPPNVVWVTLDSVRADHTTMGGYERDTTPALQRIAAGAQGRYFDQCISHGRYTRVSSSSMLTGTYPSRHQIGYGNHAIPSSLTTVAERFQAQSYQTGLISDNLFVSSALGLDRGFDRATCLMPSSLSELPRTVLQDVGWKTLLEYLVGLRKHSAGFTPDLTKHSRTYLIDSVASEWLSSYENQEPFFLYIHNDQTHRPYPPPLPYRDEFIDETNLSVGEASEIAFRVHEKLVEIVANGCDLTDDEWDGLVAMYDAALRYVDDWLGNLFEYIQNGPFGETIIVVTSDHGEFFGEHGLLGHKWILDETLINVPLVTHGLDVETEGVVQHSDIMATLLGVAGADTDGIQGVDLRHENRDYAIAQDHQTSAVETLRSHNPDASIPRLSTTERSVIHDGEYKLLLDDHNQELYQLPDEATDVSAAHPETRDRLATELREWLESEGDSIDGSARGEFSDEMRSHLADLGYMENELPEDEHA
ncbi:sulfatase [Haloarcula sp. 1CSR25-25]|uniref:sulfatase n=1 Tax=Haloarcula sp. 1CSR25-25 TaxID=2862545 RepID=UPI0028957FC2|nr:sulfatase [Haloarcula sp. 1CSR25-25]MDT3434106.1 sulfatase [Haloarcula sp. 1CSR25-25]